MPIDLTKPTIELATFDQTIEFDHVTTLAPAGAGATTTVITYPRHLHAPESYVECDADGSVLPGAESALRSQLIDQGWTPVGQSAQQGGGWVMHASEVLSGSGLARTMIEEGGTFVVVEVRGIEDDLDSEPVGWALLKRDEAVSA